MRTLLFTVATNGYGDVFADHIQSQQDYATKYGYDYLACTRTPPGGISATNSSWLKIWLMRSMLRNGYGRVMFADVDALILPRAPALDEMIVPGKFIYMARELDQRINAGVIVCDDAPVSRSFLGWLCAIADVPGRLLPRKDRNLYENGHVNYVSRWFRDDIETISPRWNYTTNSALPCGEDECYINHGRGTYARKPRSKAPAVSAASRYWDRLKQGPRTFLLRRHARWYMDNCIPQSAAPTDGTGPNG